MRLRLTLFVSFYPEIWGFAGATAPVSSKFHNDVVEPGLPVLRVLP